MEGKANIWNKSEKTSSVGYNARIASTVHIQTAKTHRFIKRVSMHTQRSNTRVAQSRELCPIKLPRRAHMTYSQHKTLAITGAGATTSVVFPDDSRGGSAMSFFQNHTRPLPIDGSFNEESKYANGLS